LFFFFFFFFSQKLSVLPLEKSSGVGSHSDDSATVTAVRTWCSKRG